MFVLQQLKCSECNVALETDIAMHECLKYIWKYVGVMNVDWSRTLV